MKRPKKSKLQKGVEAGLRQERKSQGYYDGRFAPRVQKPRKPEPPDWRKEIQD